MSNTALSAEQSVFFQPHVGASSSSGSVSLEALLFRYAADCKSADGAIRNWCSACFVPGQVGGGGCMIWNLQHTGGGYYLGGGLMRGGGYNKGGVIIRGGL